MRTWLVEIHFQIPPLFEEFDEKEERRRRAGVTTRRAHRNTAIVPRS